MREKIKRYRLQWSHSDGGTATLVEHPSGEFVTYENVQKLQEEIKDLRWRIYTNSDKSWNE